MFHAIFNKKTIDSVILTFLAFNSNSNNTSRRIWIQLESVDRMSGTKRFLARRSEFSEDRRKTSRGICLSNLTEPTKPVVYTDRSGVVGRYLPTNYSLIYFIYAYARGRTTLRSRIYAREVKRKREQCSHKSKFHFNVLTKDQIKHFNWRFYGGRQPKSNSCLHPGLTLLPCSLAGIRVEERVYTHDVFSLSSYSVEPLFFPRFIFPEPLPRDRGKNLL